MDFKVETFLSPANVDTLRRTGLHKVAGAMAGTDELTIKHAAEILGTKAFMRRRETQKIAAGLQALADLTGEKVAEGIWGPLLQKALMPAIGGGVIAAMPQLMNGQELDPTQIGIGAALGGLGGGLHGMHQAGMRDPAAAAAFGQAMRPRL